MKRFLLYALVAVAIVGLATAGMGAALDETGRRSLWWAAGIALPVQLLAFALLIWTRDRGNAFLVAFLAGAAVRLLAVGIAGALVTMTETGLAAGPLILGLAGYFFALLLLEGWFLRAGVKTERAE